MKNIYIEDGELSRKDNTIKLIKDSKVKWIPIRKIKEINCFGGCTLTNEFLLLCNQNKISVHLYTWYGNYIGSFYNERINKNGKVLYEQSRYFEDQATELSKAVVEVLIKNMLNYLNQYRKKKNEKSKEVYKMINPMLKRLMECDDNKSIMGIEGVSWNYFYEFIKNLYKDYDFKERNRRPPKDIINSLISFLNTLLYNRIETQFSRTDIYTEISFLHSSNQKRNSLVLDIAELYKIDVTFRLIGYLIRKKIISKDHFEMIDGKCVIKKDARKIIITEFEKCMTKKYYDEKLRKYITIEYSMKLESYKLIKAFLEKKKYNPFFIGGVKLE